MDFVPDGYNVINEPRSDGRCGDGLAIVYKRHLDVVLIENNVQRTTIDLLITAVGKGADRFLVVNIYRPPDTNKSQFFDELADLLDAVSGSRVVLTGDFNCPATTPDVIDTRLDILVSCYNQVVVNDGPTHVHANDVENKLDLMFEDDVDRCLSDVFVVTISFSDHRLLVARMRCCRPHAVVTRYTCRDFNHMDVQTFRRFLLSLPSWSSPMTDPDTAAHNMTSI